MPRYNYLCEDCGPFDEIVPLADFANPQPCPNCGYLPGRFPPRD
jgi:putative FmdB family regulatory protein